MMASFPLKRLGFSFKHFYDFQRSRIFSIKVVKNDNEGAPTMPKIIGAMKFSIALNICQSSNFVIAIIVVNYLHILRSLDALVLY